MRPQPSEGLRLHFDLLIVYNYVSEKKNYNAVFHSCFSKRGICTQKSIREALDWISAGSAVVAAVITDSSPPSVLSAGVMRRLHLVQIQNNTPAPFWKKRLSMISSACCYFFPPPDACEKHPRCLGQLHVWREILRQTEQKRSKVNQENAPTRLCPRSPLYTRTSIYTCLSSENLSTL